MALVLAEQPGKTITVDRGISQRAVVNPRATILRRIAATSLPALARLALGALSRGTIRNVERWPTRSDPRP